MEGKINIIIGTNNFGLGPVGKVSSLVNSLKNKFNFYACGNEFDINIFEKNIFKDKLFSKDIKKIEEYVLKNNIKYAISVLDVELTKILLSLNVKVIFVDSLPFMWTQADIDEGLLPLEATVYCAQKCIDLTDASKKVLSQINNLKWINPIQNISDNSFKPFNCPYILINVGGLHSPIGNGESYIDTVIIPIINVFNKLNKKIIITGGTKAKKTLLSVLEKYNINKENIIIETLEQEKFLSAVKNCELFLTSPGLTTIYETSSLKKETIILPPQNLSQFYNIEYSKKILDKHKTINWETDKLSFSYLNKILYKGETYVVDRIYDFITELTNTDFKILFEKRFEKRLNDKYDNKIKSDFKIEGNGTEDIKEILEELIREDINEV